ncbi:two-component system sensor kinase [Corynebacterium renale]|uniref:sensor histidine kinase n=1 Tax=Corynebacterium renale TaxID=1724 RepID=UPI000DA26E13|nr:HAMP domain-containing sensor histidine kinase [Corynebacterium renale]SQG65383.1 two-component system sensor kinase [Corynebacterium renale]STC99087.1 two-component system sensor kinase [Corynebacterium renale]
MNNGNSWGLAPQTTWVRGVPLRVWLVFVMVVMSGLGLVVSSVAVASVMREVVYSRVDTELKNSLDGWASSSELFRNNAQGSRPPTDYVVIKEFADGSAAVFNGGEGLPDAQEIGLDGQLHTVPSDPESENPTQRWRAIGVQNEGTTTIVAKSLSREDGILNQLHAMQMVISLIVLVLLGLCAYFFIYQALRPLREVEHTAGVIAKGDLNRRVPQWPINTEVGQLAYAVNSMITRLQGSIEESQRKEEQMRRFVGDASHELRTPLTSISGYTELYRSGATQDAEWAFGKITAESKRMNLLVEDLLALTRAEGQRLEWKHVDMLETTLSVVASAKAAFADRQIEVQNDTDDLPMVKGDVARLHQVLLNLVTNAFRHAGPDAKVTLRLSFYQPSISLNNDKPDQVIIEVIDDGIGMSAQDASHIFERFYRADTSRSRESGGSGLGLAIVKSLVEQHGGTIEVATAPGEGSTFRIALPRVSG